MDEGSASSSSSITSSTFDAYNARLQTAALNATRKGAMLPSDIAFHRSMDPEVGKTLDALSDRILKLGNRLLGLAATADNTSSKGKGRATLGSEDDVVDRFHAVVVDSMDQLLERTDACLDEFLGKIKAPAIAIKPPIITPKSIDKPAKSVAPVIQHASHLTKPQLSFPRKPNNSDEPWYPSLKHKYNAQVPLGHLYQNEDSSSGSPLANHPYRHEITHISYPTRMFEQHAPIPPTSLKDTKPIWINTSAELERMLDTLRTATEIAIDLEHHSYRSYRGFLCLMQISDRQNDWLVDLLAVRAEVEQLNEVFTNPEIVKVLHGAESDIVWLQQDFNLYIVNLFDTFHASKLLEFPRHGLANLLEMYCDFIPDKRYQLADWRIRPLPEDMLLYARSDTHFLLFIYDNLRNALLDRSNSRSATPVNGSSGKRSTALLSEALSRSAETSLRVYTMEPYDFEEGGGAGGWDTLAKKWNKGLLTATGPSTGIGAMQREVFRSVHKWREDLAREEDESTRYILQNHLLFQLAEQPPADMAALMSAFRTSMSPVVKRQLKALLTTIRDAVQRGMKFVTAAAPTPEEKPKNVAALDVEMKELEIEELKPETPKSGGQATAVDIWASSPKDTVAAVQSALLGASSPSKKATVSLYAASRSAFLHSRSDSIPTVSKAFVSSAVKLSTKHAQSPRFKTLLSTVNQSLTQTTAIPHVLPPAPAPVNESKRDDGGTGMVVEIPFVAASQRTTILKPTPSAISSSTPSTKAAEEVDTIVVVGQARGKRKRDRNMSKINESEEQGSGDASEEASSFDFANVPNILDDVPVETGEGKKRKKAKKEKGRKGPTSFYGDFPAPPKAHSELKSGNQSITFRK